MEYVAGRDVKLLGLTFSTLPPDPLIIKRVRQGTWAEAHGLQEGDMVVAVNGLDVHNLTGDNFKLLMQKRPLTLLVDSLLSEQEDLVSKYRRSTLFDTDAWWWESKEAVDSKASACDDAPHTQQRSLDFQPIIMSLSTPRISVDALPSQQRSLELQPMTMSLSTPRVPVDLDDKCVLPCVDGYDADEGEDTDEGADDADEGEDTDEGADSIDSHADDTDISWNADGTKARIAEYVVGPEVPLLGLVFSKLPPDPLIVKKVAKGTWAELQGIQAGDMIVTVNGFDVKKLTREEFKFIVQERPLALRIDSLMEEPPISASSRTRISDTDWWLTISGV